MSASKKKILFQLTGSIAAYKACEVISRLVKSGYEVQVVASANALKFVGEATLEGLTGNEVHSDVFARGKAAFSSEEISCTPSSTISFTVLLLSSLGSCSSNPTLKLRSDTTSP